MNDICGYRLPSGLSCDRVLISEDEKDFKTCEYCLDRQAEEYQSNREFAFYHPHE